MDQILSKFDDFGVVGELTIEIYPNLAKLKFEQWYPKFVKIQISILGLGIQNLDLS